MLTFVPCFMVMQFQVLYKSMFVYYWFEQVRTFNVAYTYYHQICRFSLTSAYVVCLNLVIGILCYSWNLNLPVKCVDV